MFIRGEGLNQDGDCGRMQKNVVEEELKEICDKLDRGGEGNAGSQGRLPSLRDA